MKRDLLLRVILGLLVVSASVVSSEASAEFVLDRQCESPTSTSWWSTALWEDTESRLFRQENFGELGVWRADDELSPGIRDCFGSGTPHSSQILVHWVLPSTAQAGEDDPEPMQRHPILLLPGAADNGKRVFTFMAYALAFEGYNVFAVTFAHSNGDNYQHAEQIANVIAMLSDLYDGEQVDVVGHSMGGMAARLYASNQPDVDWGLSSDQRGAAYASSGTHYRGDIRRLVFLGTPQGGADTSFRWPNVNYTRVMDSPVNAPITWDTYYPFTTANVLVTEDYTAYGYFAEEDIFPGQAQVLSRWDDAISLPGSQALLGMMAYQQDWLTTYEGGFGFYSESRGIDDAIARGGGLIAKLDDIGIDPEIEAFIAAGRNPILPLAEGAMFISEEDRETYGSSMESDWSRLETQWLDDEMPYHAAWGDDVQRIFDGESVLGEVSGPSDGVIFHASATEISGLTSAGAEVVEIRSFDALNHLELTYAGRLTAYFFGDEEASGDLYDPVAAAKYDVEGNQIVEWVDSILDTPVPVDQDAGTDGENDAATDAEPDVSDLPDADVDADEPDAEATADVPVAEADAPTHDDDVAVPVSGGRASARSGCSQITSTPRASIFEFASLVALLGLVVARRR